jgi:phosphinothricin acetyltransferase
MQPADWPAVAAIYREGIDEGNATFETSVPSWEGWDAGHLAHSRLVAVLENEIIGWAALSAVSRRAVYAGVAETSVYVRSDARGGGAGRALLEDLIRSAEEHGIWMLQASIFPENQASARLCQGRGFRVVGRRERIAQQNGAWRDTIILERRSGRVGV